MSIILNAIGGRARPEDFFRASQRIFFLSFVEREENFLNGVTRDKKIKEKIKDHTHDDGGHELQTRLAHKVRYQKE